MLYTEADSWLDHNVLQP